MKLRQEIKAKVEEKDEERAEVEVEAVVVDNRQREAENLKTWVIIEEIQLRVRVKPLIETKTSSSKTKKAKTNL